MSEKSSHKKERRRSTSSSSYSSTSSESSDEKKRKIEKKSKDQPRPALNVNKMRLDIGYKIQQEELSDSEDSAASSTSPRARSSSIDIIKYSNVKDKKQDKSKSPERERYRSRSVDKRRERSRSQDSRKNRSRSKDIKPDYDLKIISKYDHSKSSDSKDRSKSIERKRERSRSRDRRKRRSKSRERKPPIRSPSRDKKKERSRSRERMRDRSRSKGKDVIKEKRRERSRSKEKHKEKFRRESRSPSYYKNSCKFYNYLKRGNSKSRERSSKHSRSRSRSRSRPRKRTRSRSRSFDRSKRAYDKKLNKLNILEKLGIELKVPEGQIGGEPGANTSGFTIPSYYNPAGVNPLKYAQQMQKKRLIWGSKKQEGEPSIEKKEEEKAAIKPDTAGPESVWKGTTFSQDQDGKLSAKFKRLMGIKDSGEEDKTTEKNSELIQKQEEMFSSMEKQYEVARVSTHTHRGLGLGFGVHLPR